MRLIQACYMIQLISALGAVQAVLCAAMMYSVFPVGDWLVKPATGFLTNNPNAQSVPSALLLLRVVAAGVYLCTISVGALVWILWKASLLQVLGLGFTVLLSVVCSQATNTTPVQR